jgi:DNA-binding GntR family transcriptional regulator
VDHHAGILQAVVTGDADAAARIAAEHVREAGDDMLAQMREARSSVARLGRKAAYER